MKQKFYNHLKIPIKNRKLNCLTVWLLLCSLLHWFSHCQSIINFPCNRVYIFINYITYMSYLLCTIIIKIYCMSITCHIYNTYYMFNVIYRYRSYCIVLWKDQWIKNGWDSVPSLEESQFKITESKISREKTTWPTTSTLLSNLETVIFQWHQHRK